MSQQLGVHCWEHSQLGTWWIVTLCAKGGVHDEQIADWCTQQFGYVDKGMFRFGVSQDFWFHQEDQAISCWLTWGAS
jgi:hypothetical protein